MKRSKLWLLPLTLIWLLTSCGMDFNTQEADELFAREMQLQYHEAWIFVGDSIEIPVKFIPDSIANREIYWMTSNEDTLALSDNHFIGLADGEAVVTAISVQQSFTDTCKVTIMKPWNPESISSPADMVVYANVTLHGQPLDSTMMVAAMCDGEFRGLGELRTQHGITYTQIRVCSEYLDGPDEEMPWASETINFCLYDPKTFQLYNFPQTLVYDIESHGTISNLFQLSIP